MIINTSHKRTISFKVFNTGEEAFSFVEQLGNNVIRVKQNANDKSKFPIFIRGDGKFVVNFIQRKVTHVT